MRLEKEIHDSVKYTNLQYAKNNLKRLITFLRNILTVFFLHYKFLYIVLYNFKTNN